MNQEFIFFGLFQVFEFSENGAIFNLDASRGGAHKQAQLKYCDSHFEVSHESCSNFFAKSFNYILE